MPRSRRAPAPPAAGGAREVATGPEVPPRCGTTGAATPRLAGRLMRGAIVGVRLPAGADAAVADAAAGAALDLLREFGPEDGPQGALAALATAMHSAALDLLGRASRSPDMPPEVACRLLGSAAKLADGVVALDAAVQRRQGRGAIQRVVVERVEVAAGAQAIVGTVAPADGGGGRRE